MTPWYLRMLKSFLNNWSENAPPIVWKQSSFAQAALCCPTIQYSYTLSS